MCCLSRVPNKSCVHLSYSAVNIGQQISVKIVPNDGTKSRGTITYLTHITVKIATTHRALHGDKETKFSFLKFLGSVSSQTIERYRGTHSCSSVMWGCVSVNEFPIVFWPRNLKGGIRSLFDPRQRYGAAATLIVMYGDELLYIRIWRDLYTLSLACDSPRNNLHICVRDSSLHRKGNSHFTKLLGGLRLSYEKIRGTITHLHT